MHSRHAALRRPPFPGEFALRHLDPHTDLELLHQWMNDPVVARFWRMAWSTEDVAAYLTAQHRSAHSFPYVGTLDGVPMSYWELYRADQDALAKHYPVRDHDAGIHLLLGPPRYRGRGLAAPLLDIVSTWLLDDDRRTTRVVAEPDVANRRSLRAFELAGFRRAGVVDLPNKRAALMMRERGATAPGRSMTRSES